MTTKNIVQSDISYEMRTRYPVYALSVIKDRALPDVRDGLKPVHRRILYAIMELGLLPEKGYRKCARIVGDVLGKYHPHGDTSVYDALVRMAQDFSMRYPLIDGHGNFGSVDGDNQAAMRYTEAKMKKIMIEMLRDINKNTVDFKPNFDGEEQEPMVLPSRFPNLLVNGSSGIAVGMATNIPPHNLGEVIDGCVAFAKNNNITTEELLKYVKGADFPTGGIITNPNELLNIYENGLGKISVRGKYHIEHEDNKKQIVFTEIPYQVNKQKLCLHISELIEKENIILKNVLEVRDETDREGMRVVIELTKNENENNIVSFLLKKTKLQSNFNVNLNVLVKGTPMILGLKDVIKEYMLFQKEVLTRRSNFDRIKIEQRLPIINGLILAIDNIDLTIKTIKNSKNISEAIDKLMPVLKINKEQSKAILELRLSRLTNLDKNKLLDEQKELTSQLIWLNTLLENENKMNEQLIMELLEIKNKYSDNRKTEIIHEDTISEIKQEDLIEDFTTTLILTDQQYFKKTKKYSENQKLKEDDNIKTIIQDSNKNKVMFLSDKGNMYLNNLYELDDNTPSSLGQYLPNLLPLDKDETILGMISSNNYNGYVLIIYEDGHAVKIPLSSYKTKTNRSKLSNCLADIKPILITQIIDCAEIELTDSFNKTKIIKTEDIPIKTSRNSQGKTMWYSKKQGFKVVSAQII